MVFGNGSTRGQNPACVVTRGYQDAMQPPAGGRDGSCCIVWCTSHSLTVQKTEVAVKGEYSCIVKKGEYRLVFSFASKECPTPLPVMSFLHCTMCSTHLFNAGKTGHETSRGRSRVNFSYVHRTRNRGQVHVPYRSTTVLKSTNGNARIHESGVIPLPGLCSLCSMVCDQLWL
jgi:hypothetical protein